MTYLAARKIRAAVDFPVNDDTRAYACSERDHYRASRALCCACAVLAVGCRVRVVAEVCGDAELGFYIGTQRSIYESEVIRVFHHAGRLVTSSRAADTDGSKLLRSYSRFSAGKLRGADYVREYLRVGSR